jgi:hypothetical protein
MRISSSWICDVKYVSPTNKACTDALQKGVKKVAVKLIMVLARLLLQSMGHLSVIEVAHKIKRIRAIGRGKLG